MHKKKFMLLALLSMALAMATTSAFANMVNGGNTSQFPGAGQTNFNFIGAESYGGTFPAEIVVSLNTAGDKALSGAIVAYNNLQNPAASSLPGSQKFAANKLSDCGSNGGNYHVGKLSSLTVATGLLISANA